MDPHQQCRENRRQLFVMASIVATFFYQAHRSISNADSHKHSHQHPSHSFPSLSSNKPPTPIEKNISDAHTYTPSSVEKFYMENLVELGFDTHGKELAGTCSIVNNESFPFYDQMQSYISELNEYENLIKNYEPLLGMTDLRLEKEKASLYGAKAHFVCENNIRPSSSQLQNNVFSKSNFLSHSSTMGYMEPILPMARHPKICHNVRSHLTNMQYLVHDFQAMCNHLTPHSKLVFVDMGAALDFHSNRFSPNAYIHTVYTKFGFVFDHIYAYEVTPKEAPKVYELIPNHLLSSWHWVNVGVDAAPHSKMNPFNMLLSKYTEQDFIVVKLDIDTPFIELPLAHQLRDDPDIARIVDQFYFEYHVRQAELAGWWGGGMMGSVKDSMELMVELRRRGVASHYWP